MNKVLQAAALPALALLAGACQVNVDNKTKSDIENTTDSLSGKLDNAADAIGNAADTAGDKIENAADAAAAKVGDVDVDVNLHGKSDGNSADGNSH